VSSLLLLFVKVLIKKVVDDAILPSYAHEGDAGMDVYSAENKIISPGERTLVRTGVCFAIPKGYVGLVMDKSGIVSKTGLKTVAGVIDSGYRGELLVSLIHLGKEPYEVKKNVKIAQMLVKTVESPELELVESLDETARGNGGFGSTGLQ